MGTKAPERISIPPNKGYNPLSSAPAPSALAAGSINERDSGAIQ